MNVFFQSEILWNFIKRIENTANKYRPAATTVKDVFADDPLFRSSVIPILFALFHTDSQASERELRIIEMWVDIAMTSNNHCLPWWRPGEGEPVETSKPEALEPPVYSQ